MSDLLTKAKNNWHFVESLFAIVRNGYPARDLKTIGVTGTDGKTTTCHLLYELLRSEYPGVAMISTVAAYVGGKVINTGFHVTTPNAQQMQALLKRIKKGGNKYVIIESTSHGLDQHRLLGCNFWMGVLTNVTHEHLDYHKTFEAYLKAKGKLFRGSKICILNKDDKSFSYFNSLADQKSRVLSYSTDRKATYFASGIRKSEEGTEFVINSKDKSIKVRTCFQGKYNISNILAAVSAARECGVSWESVKKVLNRPIYVPGRMEEIKSGRPFKVVVDFAHTPNALENALFVLKTRLKKGGKLIVVFGCAGERDKQKRPMMGRVAAKLADLSIITAEDPRHESLDMIISKIAEGSKKGGACEVELGGVRNFIRRHVFVRIPDRERAITLAISQARKGDIVAICGKGHEQSMAFGDKEVAWSDADTAGRFLKAN